MDPHRPPVRLHPGPQPLVREATVAEDDFAVARWLNCTMCGRRQSPLDQMLIYIGSRALATLQCRRCRDHDPQVTALRALLSERYEKET
jgi:hypothetical protein